MRTGIGVLAIAGLLLATGGVASASFIASRAAGDVALSEAAREAAAKEMRSSPTVEKTTWFSPNGGADLTWDDVDQALPGDCFLTNPNSPEGRICRATGSVYCSWNDNPEQRFLTSTTLIQDGGSCYMVAAFHSFEKPPTGIAGFNDVQAGKASCSFYRSARELPRDPKFNSASIDRKVATAEGREGYPLSPVKFDNYNSDGAVISVDGSNDPRMLRYRMDGGIMKVDPGICAAGALEYPGDRPSRVSECSSAILAVSFFGAKRYHKLLPQNFKRLAGLGGIDDDDAYFPHQLDTTPGFSSSSISCVKDDKVVPLCLQSHGSISQIDEDLAIKEGRAPRRTAIWKTQGDDEVEFNRCTNLSHIMKLKP